MSEIGIIIRAHGIRGTVRVRAASDLLLDRKHVFLDGQKVAILQVQAEREDFLVQLAGVTDRNQAEALRGHKLCIPRAELPALPEGEHYADDLVGCQVFDAHGQRLGEVTSTFPGGGHEVLVVKGEREFMLPLVGEIVTSVDIGARRIVCDPPEGLLDLDEPDPGT